MGSVLDRPHCRTDMASEEQHTGGQPTIEDCSDSDDEMYYSDSNSSELPGSNDTNNNNNNNSNGFENKNQASQAPYRKLLDRPLNIQVTAKVLFGSERAISALNAERKKPKPSSS